MKSETQGAYQSRDAHETIPRDGGNRSHLIRKGTPAMDETAELNLN